MFVIRCNKSVWNLPNTNKLYQSFFVYNYIKVYKYIKDYTANMHQRLYQSFFVYNRTLT